MRAEFPAQRLVQQMRRRVMRADAATPRVIDGGDDGVIDVDRAALDHSEMDEQIAQFLLRVGDANA